MGWHYNNGYLVAVRAGSFFLDQVLRRPPICPYPDVSPFFRSWWQGVVDAARDRRRITRLSPA